MIGLVLGDTHIGDVIIKKLDKLGKKFIIIDISKKKIFKKKKNSFPLSIGQLKFDFKAIYHLPKIIKETKKGDAYIINFITRLFKNEGFKIISQTKFNNEIVLNKGTCTYLKPNKVDLKNITIGKKIIYDLKKKGVAQGVIVIDNKVISSENEKGTDSMINKSKLKILRHKTKNKEIKGVLIKLPKPNQDLRTDLPTIGFKTVKNCIQAGLRGIVVKGKYNIFLDQNKCIKLANRKNFFIHAI
jgi:DUF1009 family protein